MAVRGYKICKINKKSLNKAELFSELENKEPKIKEIIENVILNEKGIVYGLKKGNILKAVYVFLGKEIENNEKILTFSKNVSTDEISEEVSNEFEKTILEELKECVSFEEYKKVEWNDQEIVPQTIKIGKYNVSAGIIGFFAGILIGAILLDSFVLGLGLGIIFASSGAIIKKKK